MSTRKDRTLTRLGAPAEWALQAVFHAPLSSVPDLGGWGEYPGTELKGVLADLAGTGYMGVQKMGNTRPAQERYWVVERGWQYLDRVLGVDEFPWPSSASGLALLRGRLPLVEQAYYRLRSFIGPDGANRVEAFGWHRSSSIHAIADLDGSKWVAFIGAGLWADHHKLERKWQYRFRGLNHINRAAMHDEATGMQGVDHSAIPSAVAILACDEWAAQVAVDRLSWQVPHGRLRVFTPDADLTPDLPLPTSRDSITERPPRRQHERRPRLPASSPVDMPIADVPTFKRFSTVAEWPGGRTSHIADMLNDWTDNVKPQVDCLTKKGLLDSFQGEYCLSLSGFNLAAQWDRITAKQAAKRFVQFLGQDGTARDHQWPHDRRVISLVARMKQAKLPAAAGWRADWNIPNVTQIKPDFVVRIGKAESDGVSLGPAWVYGECERSAANPAPIADKLANQYRLANYLRGLGVRQPPIMVVCDRDDVEAKFWAVGGDLLLFTATWDRVMNGPLVGSHTVWLHQGNPVSISAPGIAELVSWPRFDGTERFHMPGFRIV